MDTFSNDFIDSPIVSCIPTSTEGKEGGLPAYNYMKKTMCTLNSQSNAYGIWLDFTNGFVLAFWKVPEKYAKATDRLIRLEADSPFCYPHTYTTAEGVEISMKRGKLEFRLKVVFDKEEVKSVLERVYDDHLDEFGEKGLFLLDALKKRTWNNHAATVEKVRRRFLDTVRARFYTDRAKRNR